MKDEPLLSQLEALANRLRIEVRYERLRVGDSSHQGGLCRIREDYVLIIDSHATTKEKIRIFLQTIKGFDLDDLPVIPANRERLERN